MPGPYKELEGEIIAESIEQFVAKKASRAHVVFEEQFEGDPRSVATEKNAIASGSSLQEGQYFDVLDVDKASTNS